MFLYKETTPQKAAAIEEALKKDWTLAEKLNVLKGSAQVLDGLEKKPRNAVINRILDYAKASEKALEH